VTLDTSAILAILLAEPEHPEFIAHIENAERVFVSTVSVLEACLVMEARQGAEGGLDVDLFLKRINARIIAFDEEQLQYARIGARLFGKGRHPAGLNFGDCASYALSQWSGEPLLYKGNDFTLTDVLRVRG
jgi:ribonuclease VapC